MALNGKNILFLSDFASPDLGAAEVQLMHLVQATLDADMHVTVVAPFDSAIAEQAKLAGARVYEADFSAATLIQTLGILQELAQRDGPTIVHGTSYRTNTLARKVGNLVVNTVHAGPDDVVSENPGLRARLSARLRSAVDRMSAGRGVRIVADSADIARSLERPGADIRVIGDVDCETMTREYLGLYGEIFGEAR